MAFELEQSERGRGKGGGGWGGAGWGEEALDRAYKSPKKRFLGVLEMGNLVSALGKEGTDDWRKRESEEG